LRKRRGKFARLVTVFLALGVALGLTGLGYGSWSDTLNISGTVETGTWNDTLSVVLCWTEPVEPVGEDSTSISCWLMNTSAEMPDPDQMVLIINTVKEGVTYNCDFCIENEGDIPTAVQSIEIMEVPALGLLDIGVSGISQGTVIDPGESAFGTVSASLIDSTSVGQDILFTVKIVMVRWNEYVP